jgi:D-3-phosphoglycerate dehydrogenase
MIRILANDGLHADSQMLLEEAGYQVDVMKVPQEELESVLPDYDVIIVRSATKIRKGLIDACPNLKIIARGGVGEDNIDADYARSKGIEVMITPEATSRSVAELVFGHILSLARNLHQSNREMPLKGHSEFKELKKKYSEGFEISNRKIGIIGFGRVGQEVARMAMSLGMQVLPVDINYQELNLELSLFNLQDIGLSVKVRTMELEEVLPEADIITLHIPFTGRAFVTEEVFAQMKDGVIFINASSGGTVDESALLTALDSGKVRAAGIDVYTDEPTPNPALLSHPNISVSPHIGASTLEAQRRNGLTLADRIIAFFGH